MRMWTRSVINSGTTMSVTMTPVSGREKKEVQYWNAISIKRWTIAVTYRSRMAARFCCFFCCNSRSWRRRRIANPKPRIRWTKLKVLLRSHLSDRTTGCHPGWYTSACSSQSTSPAGEKEMKLEAWRQHTTEIAKMCHRVWRKSCCLRVLLDWNSERSCWMLRNVLFNTLQTQTWWLKKCFFVLKKSLFNYLQPKSKR